VGTRVVHLSDLTGRQAEASEQLGRLVVLEHPDIAEPATDDELHPGRGHHRQPCRHPPGLGAGSAASQLGPTR
jgi:hypothetical protein